MATNDTTPTILPAEPWYTSPVQRAQVFASLSGLAALVIQLFELQVDVAVINVKIGIIAQIVNVGFGFWGILKRSNSEIQPLTLTKAGADAKAPAAITTVDEIKSQGGFVRPLMLALLLAVSVPAVLVLPGCLTKTVTPQTFNESAAAGLTAVNAVRKASLTLLQARRITPDDDENVQGQADIAKNGIDVARGIYGTGDVTGAELKLRTSMAVLRAAQSYVCAKVPSDPVCNLNLFAGAEQ